ncbi:NACHT domain-containing protein [Actinoplanes sp. NPDC051851]|uniref:NACHT domain-containing protein n=1 Tax=Actinoplanes sp. NPDC051851 TaxID=3154753 RepID=UPI0034354F9B
MTFVESAGPALGRVVGQAAAPLVNRLRLTLIKKGLVQDSDAAGRLLQIGGPHRGGTRTLSLLDQLPAGVTNRQITAFAGSGAVRSAAQEIIAAYVAGVAPDRVLSRLERLFFAELHGAAPTELAAYYLSFQESLQLQCREVAEQLTSVPVRSGEGFDWAGAILTRATLEAIERHTATLARAGRPTAEEATAWLDAYRKAFLTHHGSIVIPDLDHRRLVPSERLFVGPDVRLLADPRRGGIAFGDVQDHIDRTVLLGDPGAGKSTASSRLGVTWFTERGPCFQVVLRDLRRLDQDAGFNLVREIERTLEARYQVTVPSGTVEDLLLAGDSLVVLDGLDEVPTLALRKRTAEVIEAAAFAYPLTRFLVTARSTGYHESRLDTGVFTEFRVMPFTADQVRAYARNWFGLVAVDRPGSVEDYVADFMTSSESADDLRTNPLLLALICILYRGHGAIPRQRPQIYRRCVEMLVRDWDTARGVTTRPWETDVYEVALAEIAHLVYSRPEYRAGMTEEQLRQVAAQNMLAEAVTSRREAVQLAADMIALCRGRGWIFTNVDVDDAGNDVYSFAHGSFLEYFTATHLVRNAGTSAALADGLLPFLLAGRGEVLSQIAVSMAGVHRANGASDTIGELMERAWRLPPDDGRVVTAFIVNTADVIPLNENGLISLVRGCVRLTRRLFQDRQLLPVLLGPDFRHASGVQVALAGALAEIAAEGPGTMREFLTWHDWAWDVVIQHGIVDFSGRSERESLFAGALHRASPHTASCTAVWLAEQVGRDPVAARQLRLITSGLRPWLLEPVDGPDLPARDFAGIGEVFNRALARAAASPAEVLGGLAYLAAGAAEIVIRHFPPHEHPGGLMGQLIAARWSEDAGALPSGVSALDHPEREFLQEWARGNRRVLTWPDDFPAQAVS